MKPENKIKKLTISNFGEMYKYADMQVLAFLKVSVH